jgi:LEA14-like dessication related protein
MALRYFLPLFIWTILFSQIGCKTPQQNIENLKKCKIRFSSFQLQKLPPQGFPPVPGFVLQTAMTVENPNPSEVEIYEFHLTMFLVGPEGERDKIAEIQNEELTIVPANSEETIKVKIKTDFDKGWNKALFEIVGKLLRTITSGRNPEFQIEGYVKIDTLFGKFSVPFNEKKEAKLF